MLNDPKRSRLLKRRVNEGTGAESGQNLLLHQAALESFENKGHENGFAYGNHAGRESETRLACVK